jgi:alpha-ketoglutarate-dependent taurine dioxygenase
MDVTAMMHDSGHDALADDWLSALACAGWYSCNLADRLGGPVRVTDDVLLAIGTRLAGLFPGLTCGPVTRLSEVRDSPYVALSRGAVPFHTENLYLYKPPHYLLLYCDTPADRGGDTLLIRGDEALGCLGPGVREVLERHRVRVRYGDYCVARHLVASHPIDGTRVLLFFEPDPAVSRTLELGAGPLDPAILSELRGAIEACAPRRQRWRTGDLLVIDNFKVLHARTPYEGPRLLRRVVVGWQGKRG